jgi:acyl-CoA synthetase (AMP-forming)/AMP-acid ligase II
MSRFGNLGDLIPEDVDRTKTAIIDLGGEDPPREFSFGQLDEMARGVARGLTFKRYARGDRIAVLSANRAEYIAAVFGIMRAGMIAVPVSFKFPRETIRFILEDSGAKLVLVDPERRNDCGALRVVEFGGTGAESFSRFLDLGRSFAVEPEPREPALFLYTSGSTGVPKGVVLSHQSHLWVVQTRLEGQDLARHRFLIAAPLYHMNALALSQLAVAAGATIVLLPQFSAGAYIDAIERYRATWLTAVPPMIAMMLRHPGMARADLSSVESLRMGSAPVSESLMRAIRRALPQAAITNAYGTTEAGPVVFARHPQGIPTPDMSVGVAHPMVELRLASGGNEGELQMKCPAVMNGYHNRPDIPSPIGADGFYATGDVFRRDENGFYYFIGRTDDMFVSGGENIYPGDVERMLESHPAIAQACVVPVDDDIKGTKPVAFVIPRAGQTVSEAEIKGFALANAPAFQHPRFVWSVDRFPLTSTNKIDRRALIREAAERVPRGDFR